MKSIDLTFKMASLDRLSQRVNKNRRPSCLRMNLARLFQKLATPEHQRRMEMDNNVSLYLSISISIYLSIYRDPCVVGHSVAVAGNAVGHIPVELDSTPDQRPKVVSFSFHLFSFIAVGDHSARLAQNWS